MNPNNSNPNPNLSTSLTQNQMSGRPSPYGMPMFMPMPPQQGGQPMMPQLQAQQGGQPMMGQFQQSHQRSDSVGNMNNPNYGFAPSINPMMGYYGMNPMMGFYGVIPQNNNRSNSQLTKLERQAMETQKVRDLLCKH